MSNETAALQRWVIASNNAKKLKELQLLLGDKVSLSTLADHGIESPDETGTTFVENALIKARTASLATGLPSLADDSGIVVPALNGAPGLYSARYAYEGASDAENNQALIAALKDGGLEYAEAHYHCTLVFLRHADDPDPIIAQGRWQGRVYPRLQGDGGFGYDPMFYLAPDYSQSSGQIPADEKAALSHRGIAIREFQRLLQLAEAQV